MGAAQYHVVRRQTLDIRASGTQADGLALQHRLPALCRNELGPALEQALDRLAPLDRHVRIERLEVDAGALRAAELDQHFAAAVAQAVERRLREWLAATGDADASDASDPAQPASDAQHIVEALVEFLRTGLLPWHFHLPRGQSLEQRVDAQLLADVEAPPGWRLALVDVLRARESRRRLVGQFSAAFLHRLLRFIGGSGRRMGAEAGGTAVDAGQWTDWRGFGTTDWLAAFEAVVAGRTLGVEAPAGADLPPRGSRRPGDALLAAGPAPTRPDANAMRNDDDALRDRLSGEPALDRSIPPAGDRATAGRSDRIDLDEGLFVDLAGLVLLHPFLHRLFERLEIADAQAIVHPDRALCLLHFVATGQPFAPEYELAVPKVLCGLPLEAAVDSHAAPSAVECEEATAMLGAVIRHWDALGRTSQDGLRGSFLARPGKLSRRDDGDFVLQVEPSSIDILLSRLPWAIGPIKLPWMRQLLWVEWPDGM
jgi:hypothetical protein